MATANSEGSAAVTFDPIHVGLVLLAQLPPHDNAVLSPHSIATVLAMLFSGSRGVTRKELSDLLCLSDEAVDKFVVALGHLLSDGSHDSARVRSSTAIYAAADLVIHSSYVDTAKRFAANIANLDFAGNPDAARRQINSWVATETADLIKDMLPQGSIDSRTVAVIANTVYFKGLWLKPFEAHRTQPADFHTGEERIVRAQMMNLSSNLPYAIDQKHQLQLLLLPYSGEGNLSLLLLLPFEEVSLDVVLGRLHDGPTLAEAVAKMEQVKVNVGLPRMSLSSSVDVKASLTTLGLKSIFDSTADLTGICPQGHLYVSSCIHRAVIEVTEEGTVAAAATAAVVSLLSFVQPASFVCNRPFAFAVWHEPTSSVLFLGRVNDPTSGSGV